MGHQLFIPVRVTLLNWIITILAGSLIYAFLDAYFTKSDGFLQIVQFVGFATVYSGLYSLPALIILLLVNWWLNKRSRSPRSYQVIHTIVQLLIAGGSFLWLVWGWGSDWFTYVDLIYLLPFLATYAGVTLIVWAITFSIYRSKDDMD
ncbi:MAG TPA: hypothetical protein VK151_03700 [Fluviicola sp.]|nr:hypothetical protein [Fluviicola sp.]